MSKKPSRTSTTYWLIQSFDELCLGQLVYLLNVTELSNANSHSVSLLNEFRGVCIYQRGSVCSLIEYDAYTFKEDVFFLTIVGMKTDIRRTIYTCYLITDWKNGEWNL